MLQHFIHFTESYVLAFVEDVGAAIASCWLEHRYSFFVQLQKIALLPSFLTFSNTGAEVMLQGYTQFVDNSGRQNYYSREYFQRTPRVRVPGDIRALPITR